MAPFGWHRGGWPRLGGIGVDGPVWVASGWVAPFGWPAVREARPRRLRHGGAAGRGEKSRGVLPGCRIGNASHVSPYRLAPPPVPSAAGPPPLPVAPPPGV